MDFAIIGIKLLAWCKSALAFALAHWRETLIVLLAVGVAFEHHALTKTRHSLTAEKAAHATDNRICKENQQKADAALRTANGSIDALKKQADADTAAAQKAVTAAQRASVAAGKGAQAILARKPEPAGVCASIHALRLETSR